MTFIDSRVYPMFAFLFGYGMVQLYRRQVGAGTPVKAARRLLQRRNLWLLVFGFVHAALLWYGDVLGAYGLAGLIMVALFFKRRDQTSADLGDRPRPASCCPGVSVGGWPPPRSPPGCRWTAAVDFFGVTTELSGNRELPGLDRGPAAVLAVPGAVPGRAHPGHSRSCCCSRSGRPGGASSRSRPPPAAAAPGRGRRPGRRLELRPRARHRPRRARLGARAAVLGLLGHPSRRAACSAGWATWPCSG